MFGNLRTTNWEFSIWVFSKNFVYFKRLFRRFKWAAKQRWTVKCFRSLQMVPSLQFIHSPIRKFYWKGADHPIPNNYPKHWKSNEIVSLFNWKTQLNSFLFCGEFNNPFKQQRIVRNILSDRSSNMCLMVWLHITQPCCCCSNILSAFSRSHWRHDNKGEKGEVELPQLQHLFHWQQFV